MRITLTLLESEWWTLYSILGRANYALKSLAKLPAKSRCFVYSFFVHLEFVSKLLKVTQLHLYDTDSSILENSYAFRIGFQEYLRATCLMGFSHNIFDQQACLCIETTGNRFDKNRLTIFKELIIISKYIYTWFFENRASKNNDSFYYLAVKNNNIRPKAD